MKITLEPTDPPRPHRNPKVVIEIDHDPEGIGTVLEEVVVPALLAWGFSADLIMDFISLD